MNRCRGNIITVLYKNNGGKWQMIYEFDQGGMTHASCGDIKVWERPKFY